MSLRVQLARIKRKLFKKPILKDSQYPPYWFDKVFSGTKTQIVQIGSNDGQTGDPLNQLLLKNSEWKGLFVEPVPYLFEKLKKNYHDESRFTCENIAINKGETLDFYWVDPTAINEFPDLPYWYNQVGSFDRNHIINELGEKLTPFIKVTKLEGLALNELFKRNKLDKIDLLHIDTEGYDWQILSQLDLEKFSPSFIMYEMNHLSEEALQESYEFLNNKYELYKVGIDMLAVNRTLSKEILLGIGEKMNRFNLK